jgi:cell division protein FtsX
MFTAIFTSAAVLAVVIGGLSVVNTMIMAVDERVREIGLQKALGAHTFQVVREYMLDAAVIGARRPGVLCAIPSMCSSPGSVLFLGEPTSGRATPSGRRPPLQSASTSRSTTCFLR